MNTKKQIISAFSYNKSYFVSSNSQTVYDRVKDAEKNIIGVCNDASGRHRPPHIGPHDGWSKSQETIN